jgi:hypothetical protein
LSEAPRRFRHGRGRAIAVAALLALVTVVLLRCAPPLTGSDTGDDDRDSNDFCFYAHETRTLELVEAPDDEAMLVLPLALDGLVDTAPAEVRADAQLLLDAAIEAGRAGTTRPLLTGPVQAARDRLHEEATQRCR